MSGSAGGRSPEILFCGDLPSVRVFWPICPREARRANSLFRFLGCISIHVPARGTTRCLPVCTFWTSRFQSTCLREARPVLGIAGALDSRFQSTCLREARPGTPHISQHVGDFNPRAYARHDREGYLRERWKRISIHVPTRGTTRTDYGGYRTGLFQSTCLREARPSPVTLPASGVYFNPRAYARHDGVGLGLFGREDISIHVPTRGTTSTCA